LTKGESVIDCNWLPNSKTRYSKFLGGTISASTGSDEIVALPFFVEIICREWEIKSVLTTVVTAGLNR
jgi:hypothetical protein